jgi:hypothetical protein
VGDDDTDSSGSGDTTSSPGPDVSSYSVAAAPNAAAPAYLSAATALTDPSLVRSLVGFPTLTLFPPNVAFQRLGRPSWPDQCYECGWCMQAFRDDKDMLTQTNGTLEAAAALGAAILF